MQVTCPHCDRVIELVGPAELKAEFGMNANHVAYRRSRGAFPEPWLLLNNRHIYLRDAIDGYLARMRDEELQSGVTWLKSLTPADRERVSRLEAGGVT